MLAEYAGGGEPGLNRITWMFWSPALSVATRSPVMVMVLGEVNQYPRIAVDV